MYGPMVARLCPRRALGAVSLSAVGPSARREASSRGPTGSYFTVLTVGKKKCESAESIKNKGHQNKKEDTQKVAFTNLKKKKKKKKKKKDDLGVLGAGGHVGAAEHRRGDAEAEVRAHVSVWPEPPPRVERRLLCGGNEGFARGAYRVARRCSHTHAQRALRGRQGF